MHPRAEQRRPSRRAERRLLRDIGDALPILFGRLACRDQENVIAPQDARQHGRDCDQQARRGDSIEQQPHGATYLTHLIQGNLRVQRREVCHDRGDDQHSQQQYRSDEAKEEVVVPLTHAIVDERAMVVVAEHTVVAIRTMRCTRRTHDPASSAPTVPLALQLRVDCRLGAVVAPSEHVVAQGGLEVRGTTRRQDHLPPGNDTRVCATCGAQQASRHQEDGQHREGQSVCASHPQVRKHPQEEA
mmetsp:Transcript_72783/g.204389  ORF Transcript_72783/g.204389 Transcript_72783/m.204389 type:complete len:244 (-) Transcript_72783:353-1084(-)